MTPASSQNRRPLSFMGLLLVGGAAAFGAARRTITSPHGLTTPSRRGHPNGGRERLGQDLPPAAAADQGRPRRRPSRRLPPGQREAPRQQQPRPTARRRPAPGRRRRRLPVLLLEP